MRGLSLLYYTICWVLKRGNEHSYSKGAVHGVHSCLFTFFKEFLLLLTFDIPHVFLASVGLCFFCSCILLGPTLQIYIYKYTLEALSSHLSFAFPTCTFLPSRCRIYSRDL